jgi:hypothetical protein
MVDGRFAANDYQGAKSDAGPVIRYFHEDRHSDHLEVPDFIPTRHELIHLAKYWAREALEISWFIFVSGSIGCTELKVRAFAWHQISHIASRVGDDRIEAAIDEVYDDFRKEVGDTLWDIYINGDQEQWDRVQDEFYEASHSKSRQPSDPALGPSDIDAQVSKTKRIYHFKGLVGWEAGAVPEFVPIQRELVQIGNYWVKRKFDAGTSSFRSGETHETQRRLLNYAEARIGHIADLLDRMMA